MAIKTKIAAQSLVLTMNLGEDKNGKIAFKNLSLKQVKPNATDEGIHTVAEAVKGILPYPVEGVSKNTLSEIVDDTIVG
ncbi:DUF1659 domain-containing protein [Clostridium cylindrosporum]|uniref:DUF1659 domain-containing protein n=1 Tax=Clostridium cylindrosporum DSM 605 TaxID=1121307 RepID=A0A0J8DFF0_CLOCY|nr:DUF1659 domain-containing protein [Clostridium cylindrosporum]KMT22908.1 hypothetical protein CLCY_5c01470 [Clostridium cylindrosporum DSM 605]